MNHFELSLTQALDRIRSGALTSETFTRALLERSARFEPHLDAFAWLDPEAAMTKARRADSARTQGALHGVPFGVKDIFDTAGVPTRMGSPAYFDHIPSRSARLVERLEAAGGFVFGKTVTAELAYYVPGRTRNPWNGRHTPGGSSSGSAAAVAAGLVPAALGTQTNGSVIRPAAYCGCVGFKPTAGWLPRTGVLAFSPTLDQIGVFTRTLEDAAVLLATLAGYDADDPASVDRAAPSPAITPRPQPPRLLAIRSPVWGRADEHAQAHFLDVVARLRAAGAHIDERELPEPFDGAHEVHRTIMYGEAARLLVDLQRRHTRLLSGAVNTLIEEGLAVPQDVLRAALGDRGMLGEQLADLLAGYDGIVTPPATGEAPATLTTTGDPVFCTIWTLCGVPALSLPTGRGPTGLPLGTQLVGPPFSDGQLLGVARWCEDALAVRLGFPAVPVS
jgi:Asp-tRNA(Asn)/Glu-tRNA(Gln) amidotransferase A subunit family amidase